MVQKSSKHFTKNCYSFYLCNDQSDGNFLTISYSPAVQEEIKNRKSRKLDPGQDLTPDIVTWLPVLLTASKPGCQLTNETASAEAVPTTTTTTTPTASKNKVEAENGQKTLVEDGLVFRSPEMKRSLRRNKKKKLSKKSPKRPPTASGSSSDTSEEASTDSFCETLKRHRRPKPNTNNNNNKKQ